MPEEDKGFEVKDRRKAKEALEGGPAMESEAAREEQVRGSAGSGPANSVGGPGAGEEKPRPGGSQSGSRDAPAIDFLSFVGSLAATAFMQMGEKIAPGQPDMPADMAAAKQMIDLIDLLKTKTRGNLEKAEEEGLEAILYNLRMRFLQKGAGK